MYVFFNALSIFIGSSWKLEYQFTKAYDVPDLDPKSVKQAAQNIFKHNKNNEYLQKYVT